MCQPSSDSVIGDKRVKQGVRIGKRLKGITRQPFVLQGTNAALDYRLLVRAMRWTDNGFDAQRMEQLYERRRIAVARLTAPCRVYS